VQVDTSRQVTSVSGPSKSGKRVLVARVVGRGNLITVTGAGINDPEDLWSRMLDWMDVTHFRSIGSAPSGTVGPELGVEQGA
jgi:hypothetical protein